MISHDLDDWIGRMNAHTAFLCNSLMIVGFFRFRRIVVEIDRVWYRKNGWSPGVSDIRCLHNGVCVCVCVCQLVATCFLDIWLGTRGDGTTEWIGEP